MFDNMEPMDDMECERENFQDLDGEPMGSYDLSDDAYVLTCAGMGTDEDYGCFDGGLDEW